MSQERLNIVKAMAAMAWSDGRMDKKEKEKLRILAKRMDLDAPMRSTVEGYLISRPSIASVNFDGLNEKEANALFLMALHYAYMDGRINGERLQQMVDTFRLTIAEEAEQQADAEQATEENQQLFEQQAWLQSTGDGPKTLRDELDNSQQADESALVRIELFNAQNKALREEMERFKTDHAQRMTQLQAERDAFEKMVKQRAEQTEGANFQQVVGLYQTQPAKLTKQAFQSLIKQGQTDQVVEYLAAMSSRKAGKVLSQFKTPEEIEQAAGLLERLRTRDEYLMDAPTIPAGTPS